MMGWSPGCYIPSFKEFGRRFWRRRFLKGFYHIWTWRPSWSSLYLKAFIQSSVQIGTVSSEKIQFEFLYVHDLWPKSRNDLDFQYSHIFIYSIRCLLLLTFRSLAANVSEKSTVFTFSYRKKPKLPNLTLP